MEIESGYEKLKAKIRELEEEVSKLKRDNEAFFISKAFLNSVIEQSPNPMWVSDKNGTLIRINPSCLKLLDIKKEEVVGKYNILEDNVVEEHGALPLVKLVFEKGKNVRFNIRYDSSRLKGITLERTKIIELDVSISPIKDKDGNVVNAVIHHRDITRQRNAEKVIWESQERYRKLVENINDVIFRIDNKGKITYISPVIESIIGYSPSELIGKYFMDMIYKEDHERVTNRYKELLSGVIEPLEYRVVNSSGSLVWVRSSSNLISEDGNIIGTQGVLTDISQQKKAEEDKKQLERQLQHAQRMESIGTLAGGIAHDFNNILTSVIGFTELAHKQVGKGEPLEDYLNEVLIAGNRARELIKQILTFSRRDDKERNPVQIKPIVKEAIRLLRASLPSSIEIRSDTRSESLALADPTQIHQVLMNLCSNAADAMEESGGILMIELDDQVFDEKHASRYPDMAAGDYIKLIVRDTGDGIPEDILARIFDPFFTTKSKEKGTGMGLSVVHGIVKNHRGIIIVESEQKVGTTFKIFLPIVRSDKRDEDIILPDSIPRGTERILFVDDEKSLVKIGKQGLESLGYNVEGFTDSIQALKRFNKNPEDFDLVVTDMTMPNLRGDELAKKMIAVRNDIPVILCTGYSKMIDNERASAMGISSLVIKPVLMRELAVVIRNILDNNQ
jgi:PAS domain S-box-containing protein